MTESNEAHLESELTALCQKLFGGSYKISGLKRLTGGASSATWSFDYHQTPLILRQKTTNADDLEFKRSPVGLKAEGELIALAGKQGVNTPVVYAVTDPDSALGESMLMNRMKGEALPQVLFKDPQYQPALSKLTDECAQAMARIHSLPLAGLEAELEVKTPASVTEGLKELVMTFGNNNPVLSCALKWMTDNCPDSEESVLVHADFRMGNLLLDSNGIAAVLDWELAHIGDPISDISHLCAPPWRFGRYSKEVGGFGNIADLVAAYEGHSGRRVDPKRLSWWRVQASVNWCVMCMIMANIWRSGADREFERSVIGTRVSESEIDILLLFDEMYGFEDSYDLKQLDVEVQESKAEIYPNELATAVIEWLSDDVIPNFRGREAFKARVARNALRILQRAVERSGEYRLRQTKRLAELGLSATGLIQGITDGTLNITSHDIREHLKLTTLERLAVDQPGYAGFKIALERWSQQ